MIIEKLKEHIRETGIKKSKIAEKLGVSAGHLSFVINGKRDLSIDLERKIRELIN